MDLRTDKNRLYISARNFTEFDELIRRAEKEAQQLHKTLRKLSCFEFEMEVSTETAQAGGMDDASLEIKDIATK